MRRDDVLKWLLETNIPIPEILQKELKKNPSAIGIFKESEADGYSKSNEITEEPKKSETNGPLGSKKTGSRPPQTELGKLAIETLLELRKEMEGEPTIVEVFLSLKKFDKGEIIQEIDRDIIQWSSQTGTDRTTIRKTTQNILSNFRRMEKRKLVEQN